MTPKALPRLRYHLTVLGHDGKPEPLVLEATDAIAFVRGYATAIHEQHHLSAISEFDPEDTRRVQALQIGDAQGWFTYLYPEQITEGTPA